MAEGVIACNYDPAKITVVLNSSDLDLFAPDTVDRNAFRRQHGIADEKIVVGYTGTFSTAQGVSSPRN